MKSKPGNLDAQGLAGFIAMMGKLERAESQWLN